MEKQPTFIFGDVEVKLTGRTAQKTITKNGATKVVGALVEIAPVEKDGPQWTKWVDKRQLFTVIDNSEKT